MTTGTGPDVPRASGAHREPTTSALPTVAVIVPAHRDGPALEACLESLRGLSPPPDELVVVADGGDEAVAQRALDAGARVVLQTPQAGPGVARNTGAARVGSEVLLFLDSDVTAHPDVVGRVRELVAEDPGTDAVIGSYDDDPPAHNLASLYTNLRHHFVHQQGRERSSTFWGACGAIRRDVFEELGGFDEDYVTPSIEDIELGYRLSGAGHRIRMAKDLRVRHLKRWDAWSLLRTDVVFRALPWSALILRSRRLENDLNISRVERLRSALVGLAVVAAAATVRWPPAILLALGLLVTILASDHRLLGLLVRRGGLRLAVWGGAWHLAYHLYTALAFLATAVRHVTFGPQPVQRPWPGSPRRWTLPDEGTGADGEARPPPGPPGVEAVVVERRRAQAASTVRMDHLLHQSRRIRWWVPLVVLGVAGTALLPVHRNATGVNGLAHVQIAHHYAEGDLSAALNAFWGPLYSWLLAPLLALGMEPLLASKVLQLAIGAALLVAVRRLCLRCGVRPATADGVSLVALPLVLHLAVTDVQPDLLLTLLLLLFVTDLLPGHDRLRSGAVLAGAWGGLAFLTKPYALPVVVVATLASCVLAARRAARSSSEPAPAPPPAAYLRRAGVVLATAVAVVAPWLVVISLHEGRPTVSTAWRYNVEVTAPGSTGQPLGNRLVVPDDGEALFAWEDPGGLAVESEGWDLSAASARRLATNLADNLSDGVGAVVGQYLVVPLFALAGATVLVRRRSAAPPDRRSAWPALVITVCTYVAGLVVTVVEHQHLWFVVLALLPLAAVAIDLPLLRPGLGRDDRAYPAWRLVGFAVLALVVTAEAVLNLPDEHPGTAVAEVAADLRAAAPAGADALAGDSVASTGDWRRSATLCFHLGCTYLGVVDAGPGVLADLAPEVDYYLAWDDTAPRAATVDALGAVPDLGVDGLAVFRSG